MQENQQGRTTTGAVSAPKLDTMTAANAAARTIGQANQNFAPLLDRLNQFSGKALQLGTQKHIDNAKKQAVVDVANGDFEAAGLDGSASIYGMAYDGAAETAFISKTNQDTKFQANRIAAQNYLNPEGFTKSWDKYRLATSKGAKKISEYINAATDDVAKQYGDAAYSKIATALATKQYEIQKTDNEKALTMYEDEFIKAKLSGSQDGAATALINRNKTLESMRAHYQISDRGIAASNKLFKKSVAVGQVKHVFSQEMAGGNGVSYAINFEEMAKNNAAFEDFTPDELEGMKQEMYKQIKGENSFTKELISMEDAKKKLINEKTVNTFNEAMIADTLTQEDVDLALEQDAISNTEYKYYSEAVHDTGAPFTDTATELRVVSNMASLTNNDILKLKDMTNPDKMKYIKQLKVFKNSEEGKWTSTVQGRASLKLLENKFNVSQAAMLAKLTKSDDMKAYNEAYQNFILEMEELPPEQRERKAMHFAQSVIDAQEIKVAEKDEIDSDAVKKRNIEAIEKRAKAYQKRVGKVKSQAYIQGLSEFMQNFGVTDDINFKKEDWEYDFGR